VRFAQEISEDYQLILLERGRTVAKRSPPRLESGAGVNRRLKVPRTNVTASRDGTVGYRSYYSDTTRELVAEWYQPEIALLDYGF